jgi:prepilin-type N-terminal cleavage/methylation domain-containing protein
MNLRHHLASAAAFTLVEMLVVLVIISALLLIGVPQYLNQRARAEKRVAQADIRATMPYAHAYYADHDTYATMTTAALRAQYGSIPPNVTVAAASASRYCLTETDGGQTWSASGPDAAYYASADCTGAAVGIG